MIDPTESFREMYNTQRSILSRFINFVALHHQDQPYYVLMGSGAVRDVTSLFNIYMGRKSSNVQSAKNFSKKSTK